MIKCEICGKEVEKSSHGGFELCSSQCFYQRYWLDMIGKIEKDRAFAVIKGHVYYPGQPEFGFKGYGGREFKIRYFDGREITTNCLWHRGEVPDYFKDRLLDSAEFIGQEAW